VTAVVMDEGGNRISARFTPLVAGVNEYLLDTALALSSSAFGRGDGTFIATIPELAWDIQGEARSAFSMEAYLNHLGSETIPYWATLERRLGPGEKLDVLTKHLLPSIDLAKKPFHTFSVLFGFRNALVHGRTEYLTAESTQCLSEDAVPWLPETKWEKMISQPMAERFLADTKSMIQILQASAHLEPGLLYTPEEAGWSEELMD